MDFQDPKTTKYWSTHLPVLIKLLSITTGDVLEVGTGIYSTPFLHWACFLQGRKLVSIENDDEYMTFAQQFESDTHKVVKEVPSEGEWDIIFVDSFPIEERESIVKKITNRAQYIIVHDSTPESWSENYKGLFKYRLDYTKCDPYTVIFSNFINVSNLDI